MSRRMPGIKYYGNSLSIIIYQGQSGLRS
uniref:Uncharacterized protein n=1 Tax=Arundo donax TaxID=35708 RepID=A0A0A9FI05_ARUDO